MTTAFENTREIEDAAERDKVLHDMAGVQARLARKGLGGTFLRAAKADPVGDLGFMGPLIFNAIVAGPVAGFFADHVPLTLPHHGWTSHFNSAAVTGGLEGLSALQDIAAARQPRAELPSIFYPKGRRKMAVKSKRIQRRFNHSAANQNQRFSYDVQMDLAEMFKMADVLSLLEKKSGGKEGGAAPTSKKHKHAGCAMRFAI